MYADSTNLLLVIYSHRGLHANPGIDERGGGVTVRIISRGCGGMMQKIFEIFVS